MTVVPVGSHGADPGAGVWQSRGSSLPAPWCRGALCTPCFGLTSISAKPLSCSANAKSGTVPASHIPSPSLSCFPKPVSPCGGASSSPRQHALNKQVLCAHRSALLLLWLPLASPFGEPGKQNNIETRQQRQRLPPLMVRDLATTAQMRFCFLVGENISGCFNVCSCKWLLVPGRRRHWPCPMSHVLQ